MTSIAQIQEVKIGTRVYTNLYARGFGTVHAIHGEQGIKPVVQHSIGCTTRFSRGADFDIVFDNGATTDKLPETILRGVQWRILDEVASAEDIAASLTNAVRVKAEKATAEQQAQTAYASEVARLKAAPEYAHLTQGDDTYSGKQAAANIRAELKLTFPGVKFSVRKTDYGSVSISWIDGPVKAQVEQITNRYKGGSFNGMEDIYEYHKSPWVEVFGGTKYMSTSREESLSLVKTAIDALFSEYPSNFSNIEKPTPEAYKKGETWCIQVPGFGEHLQTLISRQVAKVSA